MSVELPEYLMEVVARQVYEREHRGAPPWEQADPIARAGCRETARVILRARQAQTDIKR